MENKKEKRKVVSIVMNDDLWAKTKRYLIDERKYNFSGFLESLVIKYFDKLENTKKANEVK